MLNKRRAARYITSNTPTRALTRDFSRKTTMTTNSDRESAKIYQFPAPRRFAANQRDETKAAATLTPQQVVKAEVGSGWYHEAAIEEAERAHKN
jgi:uncharacterized protein DUF2735